MSERRQVDDLAAAVESTDQLDRRILRGSAWVAVSYGGRNLVTLLTTLALVRLLDPKAFGLVALAWTVLIVTDQIQNAGAAAALVYRREDVRSYRLVIGQRGVKLAAGHAGRSYLSLRRRDLTPLLLGHWDIEEALNAGRLRASTRLAQDAAGILFPPLHWYRPPLDELVAA